MKKDFRFRSLFKNYCFVLMILLMVGGCASPNLPPTPLPTPLPPTQTPMPLRTLEEVDCRSPKPSFIEVKCYDLIVPENRALSDSPTIRLHVAIYKSTSTEVAPDPIVYLSGGPGEAAIASISSGGLGFKAFRDNRDLIVFDQRGTGNSQPMLDCPEIFAATVGTMGQNLSLEDANLRDKQAFQACHDRLVKEGIDLSAYTSVASAQDAEDLRRALGIEKWNIYGGSYGTRLALTIMRDFPNGIRSAVLDSVLPPQVNLYNVNYIATQGAFDHLFARCDADKKCSNAYPDLKKTFFDLVTKLDAEPITVRARLSGSSGEKDRVINGGDFLSIFQGMLFSDSAIPFIPKMIADTANGDYTLLTKNAGFIFDPAGFAEGMGASVNCSDESPLSPPIIEPSDIDKINSRFATYMLSWVQTRYEICLFWGVEKGNPIESRPVISDIPTLILAGEFDPATPPAWSQLAAETLSHSYYFEFPNIGHAVTSSDVSTNGCASNLVNSFYDSPNTTPDSTCVSKIKVRGFITP